MIPIIEREITWSQWGQLSQARRGNLQRDRQLLQASKIRMFCRSKIMGLALVREPAAALFVAERCMFRGPAWVRSGCVNASRAAASCAFPAPAKVPSECATKPHPHQSIGSLVAACWRQAQMLRRWPGAATRITIEALPRPSSALNQ